MFEERVPGIWRMLDPHLRGFIDLAAMDTDAFTVLITFKEWADNNFGSVMPTPGNPLSDNVK